MAGPGKDSDEPKSKGKKSKPECIQHNDINSTTKIILDRTSSLVKMYQFHVHPALLNPHPIVTKLWIQAARELKETVGVTPELIKNVHHMLFVCT